MDATRTCTVDGCDRPQYVLKAALCTKHYYRWLTHGSTERRTSLGLPIRERFMRLVEVQPDGCWQWLGRLIHDGYGYFGQKIDGKWKQRRAHRVAYELFTGPIPDGLTLDHLCRNRACVNPAHLEPVTVRENTLRGEGPSARNAARDECRRGHPLSGDNLQIINARSEGVVKRRCKECARTARRARRLAGRGKP